MERIVDELGLVCEGEYLVVYIPATNKAIPFRVLSRLNKGAEKLHYGSIPLEANFPLASYDGSSVLVPEYGVMPAMSYIPLTSSISFPMSDAYDENDMWYLPDDYSERLFHVIMNVTPNWLRCDVTIPKGANQARFQRDRMMLGVEKSFGFSRGRMDLVHFPKLHYGYRFGNDSNLNVRTSVDFIYAEYIVKIPTDVDVVFNLLTKKHHAKWLSMPISVMDPQIVTALVSTYGFDGFPVLPIHKKSLAIETYMRLINSINTEVVE